MHESGQLHKLAIGLTVFVVSLSISGIVYLMWTASNKVKLGVLTAIVSVGTLVYSQRSNLNREIEARHFLQKSKIYEEIIDTLGSLFKESKGWAESEGG